MKKLLAILPGRRFLILTALMSALAVMTLRTESALARPCCSECDAGVQGCIESCDGDPDCEAGCQSQWLGCYRWCDDAC